MWKVSANKDQEKIAELAKMYEYIKSFKRSPIWPLNRDLVTLAG